MCFCKQATSADTLRLFFFPLLCAFIFYKYIPSRLTPSLPPVLSHFTVLSMVVFLHSLTHPEWVGVHQSCLTLAMPQTGKQPGNVRRQPLVSDDHSPPPSNHLLSPMSTSDKELALLMRRNSLIV